ncbi:CoA-binding protein [Niveibacterium sp. 24ML]|uniref:CoA-binding protein n=1 Tax=Niveibacterium sp. 24ML TaxID=2985512 RepID=UPI0022714CE9|nr:CoA-binding protein [Niveibacterium sp. 24ML]MCX9154652.1 CoA-binding protein [Niveibacterium sp. 24ML]
MREMPSEIASFLASHHVAVAGVSRSGAGPGALIAKRLRDSGHTVWLVNPAADEIGGEPCYRNLSSVPGELGSVMVVTAPADSVKVVDEAIARGVRAVWLHRSFGEGSVSAEAVERCRAAGVTVVEGGCPMMYLPPVDIAHRVFRFCLELQGRVPR